MKKRWIGAGVLVVAAGAAAVGVPYWVGSQIEPLAGQLAAAGIQAGYATRIRRYERGILRSTAVTSTRYRLAPDRMVDVVIDHIIEHGPRVGKGSGFARIAATRIESTVRAPEGVLLALEQALDGVPPIKAVTTVHLDGSQHIDVAVPAITLQDVDGVIRRVGFDGLDGEIELAPNMTSFAVKLNAPSLVIDADGARHAVTAIAVNATGYATRSPWLWLGDVSVTVGAMAIEPAEYGGRTNNRANLTPVSLERLRAGLTVVNGDAGIEAEAAYDVKRLVMAEHDVSDVKLNLRLGAFDPGALMRYIERISQFNRLRAALSRQSGSPLDTAPLQAMAGELRASGLRVLTQGRPAAWLEEVSMTFDGGRIEGEGLVRYAGGGHERGFNAFSDLEGSLSVKGAKSAISAAMAEVLALQQYGDRLAGLPDRERNAVAGATRFRLDAATRRGLLIESGSDLVLEASLDGGELLVNGAPPALPGLAPGQ